jgi:RNA polymerase sigma-70 factor, ECF subfamily
MSKRVLAHGPDHGLLTYAPPRERLGLFAGRDRYEHEGEHTGTNENRAEAERELEDLFLRYSPDVLTYALRRGASRADADDVVAETFAVCWRRRSEIPHPSLPFLFAVARRVLSNQRRGKNRRSALIAKIDTLSDRSETGTAPLADFADEELLLALAGLGEAEREAILLVSWEGLTHEEAAQVLGCSRSAITRRVKNARQSISAHLERGRTQEVIGTQ